MTEKELWALLQSVLTAGFTASGFNVTDPAAPGYVDIRQADQPTITGRPEGMCVLWSNQGSQRYGWVKREDVWVPPVVSPPADGYMRHTETQRMNATFQVGALAPQNPKATDFTTSPTAADLVNRAAAIWQSSAALKTLKDAGVGVFRITEIRQPYMAENDQDQFEAQPSFDFTLVYLNTDTTIVPQITAYDLVIDAV